MDLVIKDFEERAKDIQSYLRMLERMESPGASVRRLAGSRQSSVAVKENWRVIGKAAAYLLIYNLVESAVRSGFERLYRIVETEQCTCQDLSKSIRAVWLDQRHRAVRHETASAVNYRDAASRLVDEVIESRIIRLSAEELPGAGSLDAARIRDVCSRHELVLRTHRNARGGETLVKVKGQRNALAHGDKSFAECGREVTLEELRKTAKETELYVRGFLRSLKRFIQRKEYLDTSAAP